MAHLCFPSTSLLFLLLAVSEPAPTAQGQDTLGLSHSSLVLELVLLTELETANQEER